MTDGRSVIGDLVDRGRVRNRRRDQRRFVRKRPDFMAELDREGGGLQRLFHAHNVRAEEFVGAVLTVERSEIFDENTAGLVVGMERARSRGALIPERPQNFRRVCIRVGLGNAGYHVFGVYRLWEDVAVNRIDRGDPARGDVDNRAGEAFFRPVNRAYRRAGGRGNREALLVEDVAVGAGLGGIRQRRAPSDLHRAWGVRKNAFGMRTVIIGSEDTGRQCRHGRSIARLEIHGGASPRIGNHFSGQYRLGPPVAGIHRIGDPARR